MGLGRGGEASEGWDGDWHVDEIGQIMDVREREPVVVMGCMGGDWCCPCDIDPTIQRSMGRRRAVVVLVV